MGQATTTAVIRHSKHGGSELLVLLLIANHANDETQECWPSIETLAREARMTTRSVQRIVRRLEESGELQVELNAAPQGRSNLYRVTLDPVS